MGLSGRALKTRVVFLGCWETVGERCPSDHLTFWFLRLFLQSWVTTQSSNAESRLCMRVRAHTPYSKDGYMRESRAFCIRMARCICRSGACCSEFRLATMMCVASTPRARRFLCDTWHELPHRESCSFPSCRRNRRIEAWENCWVPSSQPDHPPDR